MMTNIWSEIHPSSKLIQTDAISFHLGASYVSPPVTVPIFYSRGSFWGSKWDWATCLVWDTSARNFIWYFVRYTLNCLFCSQVNTNFELTNMHISKMSYPIRAYLHTWKRPWGLEPACKYEKSIYIIQMLLSPNMQMHTQIYALCARYACVQIKTEKGINREMQDPYRYCMCC